MVCVASIIVTIWGMSRGQRPTAASLYLDDIFLVVS